MPEDITAATADASEVTAIAEEPNVAESTEQESAAFLEEIQRSLTDLTQKLETEATARAQAEGRATEAEASRQEAQREVERKDREYRGLQRESTAKLQELSVLRQALANQEITDNKLSRMERLVTELANTSLDPERVQQITRDIDQEQLRRENERLRTQSQQQPQTRQPLTSEYKQQLKNAYFGEYTTVDASELTDDEWYGNGASNPEDWKANITEVFVRKTKAKPVAPAPQPTTQDLMQQMRTMMAEEISAIRTESTKSTATAQEKITQLEEELAAQRRLAEEALNRRNGMDAGGNTPTPGVDKRLGTQLAEIPESWLYGTPEQKKAYREALNNPKLRDEIIRQTRGT